MEELNQITEQLKQIDRSVDNLYSYMNDINNSIKNSNNDMGFILIFIVLICINSNIKKLTKAIRENKRESNCL